MTRSEKQSFESVFENVLAKDILKELDDFNLPQDGKDWIEQMIFHTVSNGKMNRGLTVLSSLSALMPEISKEEQFKANALGWCVEWLQAFFLVADDIMDSSITRRGKPCWYRMPTVGLVAINDSFLLESMIYRILKKYFRQDSYYVDLLELFHETSYQTELGQLVDLITAPEDSVDLTRFSIEKHAYIVKYKTAFYSFYLPIALAMHMAGVKNEVAFIEAKNVLLPLGEYFQVQDDFLDCYGDPAVTGKIGTDILDNKCSWLINQAIKFATPEQRTILDLNYGRKDVACEALVKEVFQKMDMKGRYAKYEEESYTRIHGLIAAIDDNLLPKEMFVTFIERIYKRQK